MSNDAAAKTPTFSETAIGELKHDFEGPLLRPRDDGYDLARNIWNGSGDRHPALIARCTSVDDVKAAVLFARKHEVLTAVRGGGHSIPGFSSVDDGLMIDLSLLQGVKVSPETHTATARPGVKWGEFDRETARVGLATPGGYISTTGIAGLTLGGGIGWLSRKYGLSCDNLLSAEVVTADGELVRASENENADLFWGLRGGGGNFGIVTRFEYQLYDVPSVLGGGLVYSGDRAEEILNIVTQVALAAPDELTMLNLMIVAPQRSIYPEHMQGKSALFLGICYTGDIAEGTRLVDEIRAATKPDVDMVREMSYDKLQRILDDGAGWGLPWYEKASYAAEVTPESLSVFMQHWDKRLTSRDQMYLQQMGGKISRVADDATPFSNRDTEFVYMIMSGWRKDEDPQAHIDWARGAWSALQPFSKDAVYVNFDSDQSITRVKATYGAKYDRLADVKTKYDPTNLFRLNQNIPPRVPATV